MSDDAELHREANDRYFGSEPPVNHGDIGAGERSTPSWQDDDPPGRYAVRIVYPDGREREDSAWSTRGRADAIAARARENLAIAGSTARVEVVVLEDAT